MSAAAMPLATAWSAPPRASRDRVDMWVVRLDAQHGDDAPIAALSGTERAFAARLRVGSGAWVAARAALRGVLARELDLAPSEVELVTGANGKPRLAAGMRPDLRFNLSHSGELAVLALRLGHEVGVDVERRRPGVDVAGIVRNVFTAEERLALSSNGTADATEAFFRAWVLREALAKATGRGVASAPAPDDAAGYTVRPVEGIPGHAAAVASAGTDWSLRCFTLRPGLLPR